LPLGAFTFFFCQFSVGNIQASISTLQARVHFDCHALRALCLADKFRIFTRLKNIQYHPAAWQRCRCKSVMAITDLGAGDKSNFAGQQIIIPTILWNSCCHRLPPTFWIRVNWQ